ncbi:MAG: hypothetical protein ACXVPR_10420 [Actinomycetota bacterium]
MRPRIDIRPVAAAAFLLLVVLLVPAFPAGAATTGIHGRVVNATAGGGVPRHEVTLHLYDQGGETGTTTATTDDRGSFALAAPAAGTTSFSVTTIYGGAEFSTPELSTKTTEAPVKLKVYEPTTDPADVQQTSWVVWVDRQDTSVAIQQDVQWINGGDHAFVGPTAGGPVERLPLVAGATNFQFLDLFLDRPGTVQGSSFVDDAPLVPGSTKGTLWYEAPDADRLVFTMPMRTKSFRLFVPSDVEVQADGLRAMGQTTDQRGSGSVTYSVYGADDLAAGTRVPIALSGLRTEARSPLLAIALGSVLVLLLGIVVVWQLGRVRRPRSAPLPARRSGSRVGRGSVAAAPKPRARVAAPKARENGSGRYEPAEDDIELLIEEIAALDLSHERGLLDDRTHKALRDAAKRRLLRARGDARSPARR